MVISGENILLTFTNIGSSVFPQATKSMLDMAQSLKMDVSSAAMMLGKALNDPIAGVTALRKNGVQLSDEQNNLIQSFMAVNDIAGAQGIILGELQKEFGGSAEAAGKTLNGQLIILKNTWDDVKRTIGTPLLAGINSTVGYLKTTMEGIIGIISDTNLTLEQKIGKVGDIVTNVVNDIAKALPDLVKTGISIIDSLVRGLINAMPVLLPAAIQIVLSLVDYLIQTIPTMIDLGMKMLITLAQGIAAALPTLIPAVVGMLIEIVQVILDNIPMLLDAAISILVGLADGIIAALPMLCESIPQIVTQIVNVILTSIPKLLEASVQILLSLAQGILDSLPILIPAVIEMITTILDSIVENLFVIIDCGVQMGDALIEGLWKSLKDAIPKLLDAVWKSLTAPGISQADLWKQWVGMGIVKNTGNGNYTWGPVSNFNPVPTIPNALGGAFMVPSSVGYEGARLIGNQTVSGGETVTVTPRGNDSNNEIRDLLEDILREFQSQPMKNKVAFREAMATGNQ
jgi:hypothetical protein